MNKKKINIILLFVWYLLTANTTFAFSRQDTLRGSNGTGRNWWNVMHYDLHVQIDTATKSIRGYNTISMDVGDMGGKLMQLDLQEPMVLDSISWNGKQLSFTQEGNVWWVDIPQSFAPGRQIVTAHYHGKPREAKLPPWEGGFIWKYDGNGK